MACSGVAVRRSSTNRCRRWTVRLSRVQKGYQDGAGAGRDRTARAFAGTEIEPLAGLVDRGDLAYPRTSPCGERVLTLSLIVDLVGSMSRAAASDKLPSHFHEDDVWPARDDNLCRFGGKSQWPREL